MTYMDPFPRGTRISQEFRTHPGGYNPRGGHTGRDYAVPVGTPIRAAADGIIRHSSWLGKNYRANPWWLTDFGGDTLVLDCTDAFGRTDTMPTFIYAHCANSIAAVGQRVKKGQVIGISGNTGTATSGPHCHVERLNPNFDLNNDVYGRSPLGFDEFYGDGVIITAQGAIIAPAAPEKKEEDEKMLVIAKAPGDTRVYIGDGVTRRHIPDFPTLEAYQWLARNKFFKIIADGAVQEIPAGMECLGADVTDTVIGQSTAIRAEGLMHEEFTRKVISEKIAASSAVELAEMIPDALARDVVEELVGRLSK